MTPEQFQQVEALFDAAMAMPESERDAWLGQQTVPGAVRDEVRALLVEQSDLHLGETQLAGGGLRMMEAALSEGNPTEIGPYKIMGLIDEGGMGRVYEARQDNPRRRVALKVMRPGVATPAFVRRFAFEAHTLGLLNHPGVANVFDAGTTDLDGGLRPFFVMEYIDGKPLDVFAAEANLSQRERLELLARVCDAVQHAHQKGVIHRDLKPGNILVVRTTDQMAGPGGSSAWHDRIGQPKILDFGIARVVDAKDHLTTFQTQAGQILGTLSYMSPEQIEARLDIDARCDVYALGVMLFQLLTGRLPLDVTGQTIVEAARTIREEEPMRIGRLDRTLRGDVETIIAKALEKDPDRRYASAAEMAADIRRHLALEPILAHPPSATYQLRKFARRNRTLVGGVAATFAALLIGLASTVYYLVEANTQRDAADAQRVVVEAQRDDLLATQAWYADLLSQIDIAELGDALVEDLHARVRTGMENEGVAELEAQLEQFGELLGYANATNVAIDALDLALFERAEASIETQFAERPGIRASLLATVARAYNQLSRGEQALTVLDAAETALEQVAEPDPDLVLAILKSRGDAYDVVQRAPDAVQVRRRYYDLCQTTYGPADEVTLRAAGRLALSLYDTDQNDAAAEVVEQALAVHAAHYGELDTVALDLRVSLAAILSDAGKHAEAVAVAEETAAARVRIQGEDHELTLGSRSDLGLLYSRAGMEAQAAEVLRDVVQRSERVLGDDHVATNARRQRLAGVLRSLGAYDEALAIMQRVLDYRVRQFGQDHLQTALAERTIAGVHYRTRAYEQAEVIYRRIVPVVREALGADHRVTTATMSEHARALMDLGRFEEAEDVLRAVRTLSVAKNGADNQLSVMYAELIANALAAQGKVHEALALQETELARAERVFGKAGTRYLILARDHGRLLQVVGRYAEAAPLIETFLQACRARNHENAEAEALIELGSIHLALGELDAAEEALLQVFEIVGDAESAGTRRASLFLGMIEARRGELDAAREAMEAAYEDLNGHRDEISLTRRNWYLAQAAAYMAELYGLLDLPDEAAAWQARSAALRTWDG